MPSQFIHLSCYGAEPGARRKRHENAFDIIDEAARAPGAARHVTRPRAPVQLFGVPLHTLKVRVAELARIGRDRRGARLRRGATILYAIVVSYPLAWRKIDDHGARADYAQWRDATVEWLRTRFGDALQSVVEHVDEAQPHLHAFVLPPLCPRNRIDHRLHAGHVARQAALENGGDRLAGEQAYRAGMRAWQDDFHGSVSSRFGHDRLGPRRKRVRRDIALARQTSDRLLERMETTLVQLAGRMGTHPVLAQSSEAAEIEALAGLVRDARHRQLSGAADAMLSLQAALAGLANSGQHQDWGDPAPSAPAAC